MYLLGTGDEMADKFNLLGKIGFGLHHSGIAINGVEYSYGYGEGDETGVSECEPKQDENYIFHRSYSLGTVVTDISEVERII